MDEQPSPPPAYPPQPPRETPKQRRDRELIELLNELRLATPGVQLVFGFLLIVPFNERFADTTDFQRGLYVLSLVLTAVATILLIGASVQHRLLFRRHFEKRMLPIANRISLVGLTCLGLGMISALMFVTHFVFGAVAATIIGSLVGVLMLSIWYALPLMRAHAAERSGVDEE